MSISSLAPLARNTALGAMAALRSIGSRELTSWRTRGLRALRLASCSGPGGNLVTSDQKSRAPISPTTTEILGSLQARTRQLQLPIDTPATPMREMSTSGLAERASIILGTSLAVWAIADWCIQML